MDRRPVLSCWWEGSRLSQVRGRSRRRSTGVGLVLLDLGEDPVELAARHVGAAGAAVSRHLHLEGGAAAGAGLVVARCALAADAADQGPVLAVGALPAAIARDVATVLGDRHVHPAGEDA